MRPTLPLVLGLPTLLIAQSNTTGGLEGTIKEAAGKPVSGALLRIRSEALIGGARTARAEANGAFRFAALPPGRYQVTVEAPGFQTASVQEGVALGRSTSLHFVLRPVVTTEATVEVVAVAGAEAQAATVATSPNFGSAALAQLPTANRSLSDLLNLTPGVNRGSAWGGAGSGSNAYLMDGINVGDTSGGTQWIYTNMDWFDEVQVGGLGAPAEFGGFSGGFINTVVKRGGNTLSGTLSASYDSSRWQAQSSNRDWAWTAQDLDVPEATNRDLSVSLGGAILKDRLWYFVSAQKERNAASYVGSLATGPLPTRSIDSMRLLAKLTWQATPTATLEGLLEYDSRDVDHKYVNQSWGLYEAAAGGRQTSPSRYFNLTWTQTLGSSSVLTAKANGYSGGYDILPDHGDTPCLDIDGNTFFNNLDIAERNRRGRTSLAVTFDHFRTGLLLPGDSHAFRMGLERELGASESTGWNPGGYILTADTGPVVGGVQTYLPYGAYTLGEEDVRVHLRRTVLFAQDTWTLNPRLTLRPGLRLEQNQMNPFGGPALWDTRTLAPRLGATVALSADQRHQLKLHWGRYYDGVETGYISRSIPGAVAPVKRWYWDDDPFTNLRQPPMAVGLTFRDARASFTNLDPDARQPYADETTAAYEWKVGEGWTLSLSGVQRQWRDILARVDRAEKREAGYRIYDPVSRGFLSFYDITNVGAENWYVTNDDRGKREYRAATFGIERPMQGGWTFAGSYTRARSTGNLSSLRGGSSTFENLNNQINAEGTLPGFSDHELKVRGSYVLPRTGTRLSGSFTWLSGEHWTRTLSVNDTKKTGAWMYWSGTLYAEPLGTQTYPAQRLLNLRLSQPFGMGKGRQAEVFVDAFNLLNDCTTLAWVTRANNTRLVNKVDDTFYADYRKPTLLETPRRVRVGFRMTF